MCLIVIQSLIIKSFTITVLVQPTFQAEGIVIITARVWQISNWQIAGWCEGQLRPEVVWSTQATKYHPASNVLVSGDEDANVKPNYWLAEKNKIEGQGFIIKLDKLEVIIHICCALVRRQTQTAKKQLWSRCKSFTNFRSSFTTWKIALSGPIVIFIHRLLYEDIPESHDYFWGNWGNISPHHGQWIP